MKISAFSKVRPAVVAVSVLAFVGTSAGMASAGPFAQAAPRPPSPTSSATAASTTTITTVPRLTVDHPTQSATISAPGGTATLTSTMTVSDVQPTVDVVFAVDTTGSQAGAISAIAAGLSEFVAELAANGAKNLAFGIYGFKDLESSTLGLDPLVWVLPLTPLSSTNVVSVQTQLQYLASTVGGGMNNLEEDALLAGMTVVTDAAWRSGSQRELVLVTDQGSNLRSCADADYAKYTCPGGLEPTLANFQAQAAKNNVNVTVVNSSEAPKNDTSSASIVGFSDMAKAFGDDPSIAPITDADYLQLLENKVITDQTIVVPTLTVNYTDGTPSTDVTATVTPSTPTTIGPGTPATFTLTATAVTNPAQSSLGTVVTVDYVLQGTNAVVAEQVITFNVGSSTSTNTRNTTSNTRNTTPANTTGQVSASNSSIAPDKTVGSLTGGAARLADGSDSYVLTTTLVDAGGHPLKGLAETLTASSAPDGVAFGDFTDNGDGTYGVNVTSATPGNYSVTVKQAGNAIGSPAAINFIGGDVGTSSVAPSNKQSGDGLGFLPGEEVHIVVHSDPIDLGSLTADKDGKVPVSFMVPSGFSLGDHTIQFVGARSGAVSVAFKVARAGTRIDTGGGLASGMGAGLVPALLLIMVGAGVVLLKTRRQTA